MRRQRLKYWIWKRHRVPRNNFETSSLLWGRVFTFLASCSHYYKRKFHNWARVREARKTGFVGWFIPRCASSRERAFLAHPLSPIFLFLCSFQQKVCQMIDLRSPTPPTGDGARSGKSWIRRWFLWVLWHWSFLVCKSIIDHTPKWQSNFLIKILTFPKIHNRSHTKGDNQTFQSKFSLFRLESWVLNKLHTSLESFKKTRQNKLHSSRMRTARALTVSHSMLAGGVWSRGGVSGPRGGLLPMGWVSAPGGVCLLGGGVSAPGGVSGPGDVCLLRGQGLWGTPPCQQNHRRL